MNCKPISAPIKHRACLQTSAGEIETRITQKPSLILHLLEHKKKESHWIILQLPNNHAEGTEKIKKKKENTYKDVNQI